MTSAAGSPALGEPAARELLDVLTRPDADRAALIGRLHLREDAAWLAEVLVEIEADPDDIIGVHDVAPSDPGLTLALCLQPWVSREAGVR
jgi:hypothetical protein